jgi:calcineurin-like phosphoesterase family protein
MSRYVISDHHFGHNNIIEYCDRPFSSVGEMNNTLLDNHFETVGSDDVLIHLGDVAMDMRSGEETIEYFQRLGGDVLLRGNHDTGLTPDDAPFPVLDASIIEHGAYQFYCTHRPEDIPEWWDGWAIHGHHHNNNPAEFPLLAADANRLNVSAELLNYHPVALEHLVELIETAPANSRIRDIDAARDLLAEQESGG